MAEEFDIIRANLLPAAGAITDNDMLLVIQGGRPKRALPSAMKGKQGDPGLSVFLGVNDNYILWKQGANGTWQNLLEIEKIRGPKGEKPVFQKSAGTLQMKYEGEPDSAYVDIFDREELKMKFSDLTPAEVDQLKLHFSDLTDADKAELMKPATDAAKEVREQMSQIKEEANTAISNVNTAKVSADAATKAANDAAALANAAAGQATQSAGDADAATKLAVAAAVLAEEKAGLATTAAQNADTSRLAIEKNEQARQQAETERASAESERKTTEQQRATAETTRQTQEQQRQTNTATAISNAETATAAANKAKQDADTAAGLANTAAQNADTSRLAIEKNEQARQQAETERASAESARKTTEQQRATAETTRQTQEQQRQTNTATAISNAEKATRDANTAKQNAEAATTLATELNDHPMKIQGGVWYKWNPETDAYENTGIQAKGDPGASFRIIGQYDTAEELKAAVPDGTEVDGVYAVGSTDPFDYYAWCYADGAWRWVNQGQLRGPEGKSAYEVWISDPDNADKTLDDWYAYLRQPATDVATEMQTAITNANEATKKANTAASNADTSRLAIEKNEQDRQAAETTRQQQEATRQTNTATAISNAETAADSATEAAGKAIDAADTALNASASLIIPDIDHEPTEADLTYEHNKVTYQYKIGGECRYFDADLSEYVFYKLHDITEDGKAVWQEAGSGGSFKGETVVVAVNSTLGAIDTNLIGIILSIKIGAEETLTPIGGVPLALQVPRGKEYSITPPAVAGYETPEPASFTAGVEDREISFLYTAINYVSFDTLNNVPENIDVADTGGLIESLIGEASKRYLVKQTESGKVATLLSENDSSRYADGQLAALDGTEGDMMTKLPDMFYTIDRDTEGTRRVSVAKENIGGTMKPFAGGWVGAMKASVASGKMYSVANVAPTLGLTYVEYKAAARARGLGYELIGYDQHCQIAFLLYARYKTRDLQLVLGEGGAHYNTNNLTGQTLAIGNRDTIQKDDGYVSGLGLEGVFGCCYEYMGRAYKLGTSYHLLDPDGTERTVETGAEVHGWISHMLFEESDTFDLIPIGAGASGTSGYTDFFESAHSLYLPIFPARSCYSVEGSPYQDDGIAYLQFLNTENLTTGRYGSRLSYRGDDVQVVDAETYRSLAII